MSNWIQTMKSSLLAILAYALLSFSAYGFQSIPLSAADAMQPAMQSQRASIELQRRSIKRGISGQDTSKLSDSDFLLFPALTHPLPPPASLPESNSCPPVSANDLEVTINDAARKQALSPSLIKALIKQESGYRPCAISPKGAQGLMQLMPATAQELGVFNSFDPGQNIHGGAAYMRQMLDRYNGDLRLALIAYNAGPGRADQPKPTSATPMTVYPVETQGFVAGVLGKLGIIPTDPPDANASTLTPQIRLPRPIDMPAPILLPSQAGK